MISRPLPDESPRQSVANLIGRFETQTKRLSQTGLPITISSRSSSVVSQTSASGDSIREEVKEKREWPPKSLSNSDQKQTFVMPSYLRPAGGITSGVAAASTGLAALSGGGATSSATSATTAAAAPVATPQSGESKAESASGPVAAATLAAATSTNGDTAPKPKAKSNSVPPVDTVTAAAATPIIDDHDPGTPKPGVAQRKASTLTVTAATAKLSSGRTPTTTKPPVTATIANTSSAAGNKTPAKTIAKKASSTATLRHSVAPAASIQPLKPQHTGQSVSSASGSRKPVTTAKMPSTPSRSKPTTSSAASRAKTPTVSGTPSARPKTPSTGLFAPTAASLARSRNAPPPPPTPVKKVTLSSAAADRLSKPTAASLSKARNAAAIASPRPSVGSATVKRPAVAKTKVGAGKVVGSPPSAYKKADSSAGGKVATATVAGGVAAAVAADVFVDEGSDAKEDGESVTSEGPAASVDANEADASLEFVQEPSVAADEEEELGDIEADTSVLLSDELAEEGAEEELRGTEAPHADTNGVTAGNDIEDIVNLLESVSITKSFVNDDNGVKGVEGKSLIDEIQAEIPDEE